MLLSVTTGKTKQRRIDCTAENYNPKMAEEQGFSARQCQHTLPSEVSLNILLRVSKLKALKKAEQPGTAGTTGDEQRRGVGRREEEFL